MGIVVKWSKAFRSNLDEYVDGIELDNLQKLKDGRIDTRSWWKDENDKPRPIIWRADMKIDHGNPATICLTYREDGNEELVKSEEIEITLGTFTFKVKDDEYHGTGDWVIEGERKVWPVKWTDSTRQYCWSLVRPQQARFRAAVMKQYGARCAITGCRTEEALEAAHVVPVSQGGEYDPKNGILLRRDIHRLFDLNLVAIDPKGGRVAVADQVSDDYKKYHGEPAKLPKDGSKACRLDKRWELFKIARAGKPVVKALAVDAPDAGASRRLGFLAGQISVPDDFDRMGAAEIEALFEAGE